MAKPVEELTIEDLNELYLKMSSFKKLFLGHKEDIPPDMGLWFAVMEIKGGIDRYIERLKFLKRHLKGK